MDSKELLKFPEDIKVNINDEFEWFLVQYDLNPQKFIRKVVKTNDLIWNEELQNDQHDKEHVLIRDSEKLHLGYILYKAKNYKEAIEQLNYIQMICKQLLDSPQETNDFMENMHFNHNFWLLIMYSTTVTVKEEQSILAIFHKNNVILKKDNHSNNIMAYVQENDSTYKGVVFKISNDINDMLFVMNIIREDLLKTLQGDTHMDHEKKNQELHDEINHMEQRMYRESKLLLQAFQAVDKSKTRLRQRLTYLQNLADLNDVVD